MESIGAWWVHIGSFWSKKVLDALLQALAAPLRIATFKPQLGNEVITPLDAACWRIIAIIQWLIHWQLLSLPGSHTIGPC